MIALGLACCLLAALPLALTLANLRELRVPARSSGRPRVSVLIPARNEEANIAAACVAVLANEGVELELIVLDDGSTDRTRQIVGAIHDPRVRSVAAPPLPSGWCGKEHACHVLGQLARHELLVFVDADVRLGADALCRMAGFMQVEDAALASGFPRQILGTWSEKLLLPLIHFLLLGFLPMARMRRRLDPNLGAGCGQLLIARRDLYRAVGGHGAIHAELHDGLALPRVFRRAGHRTLLFDATPLARCRMYYSFAQVWEGLCKNATEGMARPGALPVWTVLLGVGQVLPAVLIGSALLAGARPDAWAVGALGIGLATRVLLALRFRQPLLPAVFHPLGVALLLVIQWYSLLCSAAGRPITWRGRAYNPR